MAELVEYIATDDLRGKGNGDDPYRRVAQLWTKDGKLVAENDPVLLKSWFRPA